MAQQACGQGPPGAGGAGCDYQGCINAFAVMIQEQGGGGAPGAAGKADPPLPTAAQLAPPCAPLPPGAQQQACINRLVTGTPIFSVWTCTPATLPQACIDNKVDYRNNAACAAGRINCLGGGGGAAGCASAYRACVTKAALQLQAMYTSWAAAGGK
jgi:hypothetical protein